MQQKQKPKEFHEKPIKICSSTCFGQLQNFCAEKSSDIFAEKCSDVLADAPTNISDEKRIKVCRSIRAGRL